MVRFSLYLLLSLLLVGCATPVLTLESPAAPDSVVMPTSGDTVPDAVAATPQATPSAPPALPALPATSTAMPRPSQTPGPSPTPGFAYPPPETPPLAYPPPPAETPDPAGFTLIEIPAPDGIWLADVWYDDLHAKEIIFSITNLSTREKIVLEQLTSAPGNRVPETPYPLSWSADSQLLYYSYRPSYWDGCGTVVDSTLHVYDRLIGEHRLLHEGEGTHFTFSPDRERVAYLPLSTGTPPTIGIFDFTTETFRETPVAAPDIVEENNPFLIGTIAWHPDSRRAIFALFSSTCASEGDSVLGLLNTDTLTQIVIESSNNGYGYGFYGWQDDEWFTYSRPDDGQLWRYNIETGAREGHDVYPTVPAS